MFQYQGLITATFFLFFFFFFFFFLGGGGWGNGGRGGRVAFCFSQAGKMSITRLSILYYF